MPEPAENSHGWTISNLGHKVALSSGNKSPVGMRKTNLIGQKNTANANGRNGKMANGTVWLDTGEKNSGLGAKDERRKRGAQS